MGKVFVLGVVIDFMSVPVNAGFTSAAAITIASSQVRGLLGLVRFKKWLKIVINDKWLSS